MTGVETEPEGGAVVEMREDVRERFDTCAELGAGA